MSSPHVLTAAIPPTKTVTPVRMLKFPANFSGAQTYSGVQRWDGVARRWVKCLVLLVRFHSVPIPAVQRRDLPPCTATNWFILASGWNNNISFMNSSNIFGYVVGALALFGIPVSLARYYMPSRQLGRLNGRLTIAEQRFNDLIESGRFADSFTIADFHRQLQQCVSRLCA